jgi:transposase InsO family protein
MGVAEAPIEREDPVRIHANAKLTPARRLKLAELIIDHGWQVSSAARAFRVSRQTAAKWARRYRDEGRAGMADRSSRPLRSPMRTTRERTRLITALRRLGMTHQQISEVSGVAERTAGRICLREGLRSATAREVRPANRYERRHPGELVHLDVKKLVRIERPGHRFHGDRRTKVEGAGWEFVHVAVDDHTRVAYAEVLTSETGDETVGFMERMRTFFEAHGVTVKAIMSDNGSNYRSKTLRNYLERHGIGHIRTRPYTPRTNGKAERFIRTLIDRWAYVRPYGHSDERTAALRHFLRWYNHARPHGGLNRQTPIGRLAAADDNNVMTDYT